MNDSNRPAWLPATLEVEAKADGATTRASVSWSEPSSVHIHVRLDGERQHSEADYAWKVATDAAAAAQLALGAVRAQRPDMKGPIALTARDAQSATPAEAAARDALTRISHLHYALATSAAQKAIELSDKGDAAGAIDLLRGGIAALGDAYESPESIDDTPMKLILANNALKNARPEAIGLYRSVLDARLAAYRMLRSPTTAAR
jgi:hypothetical protein